MQHSQEAHYNKIFDTLLKNNPSEDETKFLEKALITAIIESNMKIIQLYNPSWFSAKIIKLIDACDLIHNAVENISSTDSLRFLLDQGANINKVNISSRLFPCGSALHYAVYKHQSDKVTLLVTRGINLLIKTNHGQRADEIIPENGGENLLRSKATEVAHCIITGDEDTAKKMIEENPFWTQLPLDNQQHTALQLVAKHYGYTPFFEFILNELKKITSHEEYVTALNNILLQLAADPNATADSLAGLLDHGADIDSRHPDDAKFLPGATALHAAVFTKNAKKIDLLLVRGADLLVKDTTNHYAHEMVFADGSENLLSAKIKALTTAITHGDTSVIRAFLQENHTWFSLPLDKIQNTALHLAVYTDTVQPLELILSQLKKMLPVKEFTALVNKKALNDVTPLLRAVYYGTVEQIACLLKYDADILSQLSALHPQQNGYSALHIAVCTPNDSANKIRYLIRHGAKLSTKNTEGKRADELKLQAPYENLLRKDIDHLEHIIGCLDYTAAQAFVTLNDAHYCFKLLRLSIKTKYKNEVSHAIAAMTVLFPNIFMRDYKQSLLKSISTDKDKTSLTTDEESFYKLVTTFLDKHLTTEHERALKVLCLATLERERYQRITVDLKILQPQLNLSLPKNAATEMEFEDIDSAIATFIQNFEDTLGQTPWNFEQSFHAITELVDIHLQLDQPIASCYLLIDHFQKKIDAKKNSTASDYVLKWKAQLGSEAKQIAFYQSVADSTPVEYVCAQWELIQLYLAHGNSSKYCNMLNNLIRFIRKIIEVHETLATNAIVLGIQRDALARQDTLFSPDHAFTNAVGFYKELKAQFNTTRSECYLVANTSELSDLANALINAIDVLSPSFEQNQETEQKIVMDDYLNKMKEYAIQLKLLLVIAQQSPDKTTLHTYEKKLDTLRQEIAQSPLHSIDPDEIEDIFKSSHNSVDESNMAVNSTGIPLISDERDSAHTKLSISTTSNSSSSSSSTIAAIPTHQNPNHSKYFASLTALVTELTQHCNHADATAYMNTFFGFDTNVRSNKEALLGVFIDTPKIAEVFYKAAKKYPDLLYVSENTVHEFLNNSNSSTSDGHAALSTLLTSLPFSTAQPQQLNTGLAPMFNTLFNGWLSSLIPSSATAPNPTIASTANTTAATIQPMDIQ